MHTVIRKLSLMLIVAAFAGSALAGSPALPKITAERFGFDVAENALEFVFDEAPTVDGLPAFGTAFVTHGFIYPEGFLDGNDGVDDEGNPAFPEAVIGEWYCRGYFIGDGLLTETGPVVHTMQSYSFFEVPGWEEGKDRGEIMIVSQGYELAEVDAPIARPITGGTGLHVAAQGQVVQRLLGFDELEGVKLRFDMQIVQLDIDGRELLD